MKIILDQLKYVQACSTGLETFEKLFGQEAELTLENLKLFEETCGKKLYAELCYALIAINKKVKYSYCNSINCNNCLLDDSDETVESRFNVLMKVLNKNGDEDGGEK